jgi:hypothetical protein
MCLKDKLVLSIFLFFEGILKCFGKEAKTQQESKKEKTR